MKRLILVLALTLLPGVAFAQAQSFDFWSTQPKLDRSTRVLTYAWLKQVMGFTFCLDGKGYSFVAVGMSEIDRRDTEEHEKKHQEQYTRYPNCEAVDKEMQSVKGRVLMEAEAYSAGLCQSVKMGADRISLERNYAERISAWETDGQVRPFNIRPIIQAYESCQ